MVFGIDVGLLFAVLATVALAPSFMALWGGWETEHRKREFIYSTLWKMCILWGGCLAISFILWIARNKPDPDAGTAVIYAIGMWALLLMSPFFFWRAGVAYKKFRNEMRTKYGYEYDMKALEEEYGPELAKKIVARWGRGLRGPSVERRLF
jgi:hypothetical protein